MTVQLLTLHHPIHLHSSCIHSPLNPAVFPREELDEFDSSDELVKDSHAFVSRSRDTLVNADAAFSDKAVQGPASEENDKACKCRYTEKTVNRR